MSLAWAAVVLCVLLLPGFFFFVGIYFPEAFTRETTPQSPLGQLAAVVSVSLIIHLALLLLLEGLNGRLGTRPIELEELFVLLQLNGSSTVTLRALGASIQQDAARILTYITASALFGMYAGYLFGFLVTNGSLRIFASHDWALKVQVQETRYTWPWGLRWVGRIEYVWRRACERWSWANQIRRILAWIWERILTGARTVRRWVRSEPTVATPSFAYVLTSTSVDCQGERRFVLYGGHVRKFAIGQSGKPLYLLLSAPSRGYFMLKAQGPMAKLQTKIGSSSVAAGGSHLGMELLIPGDQIVNVVFVHEPVVLLYPERGTGTIGDLIIKLKKEGLESKVPEEVVEKLAGNADAASHLPGVKR